MRHGESGTTNGMERGTTSGTGTTTAGGDGPHDRHHDAVVIGGGFAGLSAGIALARALRSVLVVDGGEPRNAPSPGVHNVLGHDGRAPGELLAAGRGELAAYGGAVQAARVVAARPLSDPAPGGARFAVDLDDGSTVTARRLVLTTGVRDVLPDVPGLAEHWGTGVLHCPYCHGWEVRDRPLAVLATSPLAVHQALLWRQWTPELTLLLHQQAVPDADALEQLAARGVTVVAGEVVAVESEGGRLTGLRTADGAVVACEAVVVGTRLEADEDLLAGLGLELEDVEMGGHVVGRRVPTGLAGATAVPGVWAAGNVAEPTATVPVASAGGLMAGAMVNADLMTEDTALAVAARRASLAGLPAAVPVSG